MKYGVENIHESLKNRLVEYVKAQYFGENDLLLKACEQILTEEGNLYRTPYIESNPAYVTVENGIEKSDIPCYIKDFLIEIADNYLGVYRNPFQHQKEALELFFKGKNLLVTTGTGSGKTECFMWPMISSLFEESLLRPESWEMRGVRALLLYPMNALVSDQVGRLRKIMGYQEGKFRDIFRKNSNNDTARIPQFGMYTGRTPYPGPKNAKEDKRLADSLEKAFAKRDEEDISKLKKIGRYPAKADLNYFIESLKAGEHMTGENDAELLTRFEMQKTCPDILITNYCMLEYMLFRPIERRIWDDTKDWLRSEVSNKLLVVIDEAHMYKGASGGEVALLIRRLMYLLGIGPEKIRFILTSASMPHDKEEDKESIYKFACDFTAQSFSEDKGNFEVLFGSTEEITEKGCRSIPVDKLVALNADDFLSDDNTKLRAIRNFANNVCGEKAEFESLYEAEGWLYDNLTKYEQFARMIKMCRENPVKLKEIAEECFPGIQKETALRASQIMLTIAPLARNKDGKVLFPARIHMFFRGLPGLYACSNPSCKYSLSGDGITLGRIYCSDAVKECECGGQVYELLNDRRCGALFFKVFMRDDGSCRKFAWNNPGSVYKEELKEVHLYIVPEGIDVKASKDLKIGWLDSQTGYVYYDDGYAGKEGFIKVAHCIKENKSNQQTFSACPKCERTLRYYSLSDFKTKGNEPFFHIVKEQLRTQPETIHDPEKLKKFPNGGRKVLLFSDSRQRASVLAKDMTRAADDEASRQAVALAAIKLQEWAKVSGEDPQIQPYLYPAFLEVAYENNTQFFYGTDQEKFQEDIGKISQYLKKANTRGEKLDYRRLSRDFNPQPGLYHEQLLKLICDQYRSLSDHGICWMEASSKSDLRDILYDMEDMGIEISLEELVILFSCWATAIAKDSFAIGHTIPDSTRDGIIKREFKRYGVEDNTIFTRPILKILKEKGYSEEQIKMLYLCLKRTYLQKGEGTDTYYLNLEKVKLSYDSGHVWYRCSKCSGVYAYNLWGRCVFCGSDQLNEMTKDDLGRYAFWSMTVIEAIRNAEQGKNIIKTINTEEHTAQLSHKDQRDEMWSTTEKYEMLFQDISMDNEIPVDILSCTTTMEVGIDIGSLTAIGLRNVPPRRENYQQRAGRAGRRGTSISTIVTYANDGPHDNYYFHNPKDIIAGKLRKPWIDVENDKLLKRHISMVAINSFMSSHGKSIDSCAIVDFYNDLYEIFKDFLDEWELKENEISLLLPDNKDTVANGFKGWLIKGLDKIKDWVRERPELYINDNGEKKSVLDVLYEEGLLPSYSFPKNVVSFYIEKENGSKIEQKPERSLDIAISEYAPGKVLVVNKKTYKVGGIYSYNSKQKPGYYEKQAAPYFEDGNYIKDLYECPDPSCGWFGIENPQNGDCPFCQKEKVISKVKMLKPWGFAPINGESIRESEAECEYSFAGEPCYSTTPERDDMENTKYKSIRIAERPDETIIVLNKGPQDKAFNICRVCGAAVAASENLNAEKIGRPYKHPFVKTKCRHQSTEKVYLGHFFLTDMVVLEFSIDPAKIDVESRLWLKRAAVSLSEAFALAVSRVMDIEFYDIRSGYRIRYGANRVWVDIYLYDSLSSGAGYSSGVKDRLDEILAEVSKLLEKCNCDEACRNCLKHYWNQRVETLLDRKAAMQLLMWGKTGELVPALSIKNQWMIFQPLKKLLDLDGIAECSMERDHILLHNGVKTKKVIIYPAMWSYKLVSQNEDMIALSDKLILSALPKAYEELKKQW